MTTHTKEGAHILLVDPACFDVHYAINPWMSPEAWQADAKRLKDEARAGFDALRCALVRIGCRVTVLDGLPGLPDMVFPANAAVVLDGRALMARFRHPERQGEEAPFLEAFKRLEAQGVLTSLALLPEGCFQEGAGDCIWDANRGCFWAGFGPRSDAAAAGFVERYFDRPVIPLGLVTERAYHLDVCFAPLTGGDVLWYPPAFSAQAQTTVVERVGMSNLIAADAQDLAAFNVNAVNVGRNIVMARCTPRLRALLEARGYRVHDVPLAPFMLAGGGAFCMTLRLDRSTVPFVGRDILVREVCA